MHPLLQFPGFGTWTFKLNEKDSPSSKQCDTVRNSRHTGHHELKPEHVLFMFVTPSFDITFYLSL
jgi:hypothetical protein